MSKIPETWTGRKIAVIEGEEFNITEGIYRNMLYFAESEAIEQTDKHNLTFLSQKVWLSIVDILEKVDFNIPKPLSSIVSANPR